MTPFQYAAFRAWYEGLSYSLLGASDDLAVWGFTNATRSARAAISPDLLAVDRMRETAVNDYHYMYRYDPQFAVDNANLQFCATVKPVGRTLGIMEIGDRNWSVSFTKFDLGAGTLGDQLGLLSRSIVDRGNGWYRLTVQANLGAAGIQMPYVRLRLFDNTGAEVYTGNTAKGFDVCETQVRFVTGNDLFVPTESDGTTLGAAGGSSWFMMPLAIDTGLKTVECRFTTPFKSTAGAGLNRIVTAEVEVRNA
jgi:hypothetical protein